MGDLSGITSQQLRERTRAETDAVRAEVLELLRIAREARDRAPWNMHIHRFYETVFPQMARRLPPDEADRLCLEFARELERLEALLVD